METKVTLPALPETFKVSFDYNDNHCPQPAELAAGCIDDPKWRTFTERYIAGLNYAQATNRLRHLALGLALDDEYDGMPCRDNVAAAEIDNAADAVETHAGGCGCTENAADENTRHLEHLLEQFEYRICACSVLHGGPHPYSVVETADDIAGPVTLDRLTLETDCETWETLEMVWDGRTLATRFNGPYCGPAMVNAVPLTEEEDELRDRWLEIDDNSTAASHVLANDRKVLETAFKLWHGGCEYNDLFYPFTSLIEVIRRQGAPWFDTNRIQAVSELAPNWAGTIDALFNTADAIFHTSAG